MARLGRPLFFVALVAAVAVLVLQSRGPAAPEVVVLITVDTLRADAVGEDTPALLELASRGRTFSAARTTVPLTLPAHVTVFTGLLPPRHGIRDNASPPLPTGNDRPFPLLAEEFKNAGYQTAGFAASPVLDPRYGLDSGFSRYEPGPSPQRGRPSVGYHPAEKQVERVLAFLKRRPKGKPLFLWVHLFDPHAPYRPYDGDAKRAGTAQMDSDAERYAGEVRRADAAVAKLIQAFDQETTLFVVTSDHGESLGEHGESTHGHLCFGATMDVPLIVAGPGVASGTDTRPCSLADLAPTLRELCGLDPRATDGADLLAPSASDKGETPRVICGESLYVYRLYHWAQQTVAFDGRYSLVDGGPTFSLFDRSKDPGETTPLENRDTHAAFAGLDSALQRYRASASSSGTGLLAGAPTIYGSGRIPLSDFEPPAINRKRRAAEDGFSVISLIHRMRQAIAMRDPRLVEALLPELKKVEDLDKQNPAPAFERGRALRLRGSFSEAADALEISWNRGYVFEDALKLRLLTLVKAREPIRARAALQKAKGRIPPASLAQMEAEIRSGFAAAGIEFR